eukprot:TRINITY_DN17870_c0_g1_i1.p1 TRINITY_DN17870_c0_g1~~TRINITY_DN17870_c0_g1_i1.p1  ORF type:complete len:248 (+),score=28.67 TRINITY_DN17870_c0_g1_i1:295-1038(+)
MSSQGSLRKDGRTFNQLRGMVCDRGLLHRADGSAKWSQDGTSVLVGVYGPKNMPPKREDPEKAVLEVLWKPKSGIQGPEEREAEIILRRTLEAVVLAPLFPRAGISVIVLVIHDDGALLSCAINAACAALVDAGIPMTGLLASATIALAKSGDSAVDGAHLRLDPTREEQEGAQATVCLALESNPSTATSNGSVEGEAVVTSTTRGAMAIEEYLEALDRCRMASRTINAFARLSLDKAQRRSELPGT